MNQIRTVNITDLDSLNLQYPHQHGQQQGQHQAQHQTHHQAQHQEQPQEQHQAHHQEHQQQVNDLNDFRSINLPLSDCNIQLIDSHLLSNLSLHDGDSNDRKDESMSTTNITPELPVLTFSGMLTSSDLDGPDGFGRSTNPT